MEGVFLGLHPVQVALQIASPELDSAIEPVVMSTMDDVMPAACRLTGSFTCCGHPQKCEMGDASPSSILHLNMLLSHVCIKRFYKYNFFC